MKYEQRSPADHVLLGFFLEIEGVFLFILQYLKAVLFSWTNYFLLYQPEELWTI